MELDRLLRPVVTGMGYVLWGLEYRVQGRSALLRLFIDAPQGVTLDDCAAVSDQVSGVLDVEDPIPVPYRLEVSSPGLDRLLFEPAHYDRYRGEEVRVRTAWPVEGQRNFRGVIRSVEEGSVELEVDGRRVRLPLEAVTRARLVPRAGQ
ncbi:ribosome maturation factor RimP [Ectothiorhodospira mobilis]|uniref:ribosome maturation factor RimP n=1 Tax=Ectothiorhodospira mobilis TaxID=195064 RepID=UPI000B8622C1|nr:ribosome maturation factor RimP [Ectothiorhodospira mobilis]MCG5535380.1 ribosome maturation factor RimP [Ectothiorhodospira mobilis]